MATVNTTIGQTQCFFLTEVMETPSGPTYVTAIITCVLNSIFAVMSTFCNAVLLYVIIRNTSLHSPSNVLLGSLALCDLVIGLITQPSYVIYKVTEILVVPDVSCVARVIHWVVGWICSSISMMTITALAVERYLALRLHLRYATMVTVRRTTWFVTSLWFGIIIGITSLFAVESDRYWTFIPAPVLVLNLVITFTAYWKIFSILQKHRNQIQSQMRSQSLQPSHVNMKRYRKSTVTAMLILALLLLCYIPFLCAMITRVVIGYTAPVKVAYELFATILYLNSMLNPFLFCYRVHDIKREVKKLVGKVCRRVSSIDDTTTQQRSTANRREIKVLS